MRGRRFLQGRTVSTSTSGTIVTDTSTDLGSIVIGWGKQHSDTEITTPKTEDVAARRTGRGNDLAVDIAATTNAPADWKATHSVRIYLSPPRLPLTSENATTRA